MAGCSWILPEDRERFARAERAIMEFSEKWLEKKIAQDDYEARPIVRTRA